MKEEARLRLLKHINFLEEELKDYQKFKSIKQKDYTEDRDKRRNVERWIENIINSSIDISKIILALEDIRLPDNYKEIVKSVSIVKGLNVAETEAEALSNWVWFRNIVAHEYLDIRWNSIKKFVNETEPLYKGFLEKLKQYLEKQLETH